MRSLSFAGIILLTCAAAAGAQTFSSGSTGLDGDLVCPPGGGTVWVQLPDTGVLNYKSISVGTSCTVAFRKNPQNTPVILLVQENVVVSQYGSITVVGGGTNAHGDYDYTMGGPGGFDGAKLAGQAGQGPGGGATGSDNRGRWVGPLTLVPPVGGSGGGAGGRYSQGSGGGGAIVIAANGTITVDGTITADAANEGGDNRVGGSGGAIRLVANEVIVHGALSALGAPGVGGQPGNNGLIRLEGPEGKVTWTGSQIVPSPTLAQFNPMVIAGALPTLTITSIGGFPVPYSSGGRTDAADLVLPRQLTDPIALVVTATNIPVGTPIVASFGAGTGTATSPELTGALESSTATLQISGMLRDGTITFVYVTAIFNVPGGGGSFNPAGADHVANMRVQAELGKPATYAFLRADGSEVDAARLPKAFLNQFGR